MEPPPTCLATVWGINSYDGHAGVHAGSVGDDLLYITDIPNKRFERHKRSG
jgi:hypothetical protein